MANPTPACITIVRENMRGCWGLALIKGYPLSGYKAGSHPVQQEMRQAVAKATGVCVQNLKEGIDGCGVPTFRVSAIFDGIRLCAIGRSGTKNSGANGPIMSNTSETRCVATRKWSAVKGRYETNLMQVTGGRLAAKLGAEASLCVGECEQGPGVCLQGSGRRHCVPFPHFCTHVLWQCGWLTETEADQMKELHPPVIHNDHGEVVGRIEISED